MFTTVFNESLFSSYTQKKSESFSLQVKKEQDDLALKICWIFLLS